MAELVPGIYQLRLELPGSYLEYVNVYLIKKNKGYLLVDTGWNTEETLNSLKQQFTDIKAELSEINEIVLTHIHHDHCGLAGTLKEISKAKIYLHDAERSLIDSRYVHMDELLRQMRQWLGSNGVPAAELPQLQMASVGWARYVSPVQPDVVLHGDETIPCDGLSFRVIWTPGHSAGHICLYEPNQKVLISGDHILPTITPNIARHRQSSSNPLGDFISSLNRMKQLDVDLVLPGHEKTFSGLQKRVDELLRHHQQRNAEILTILNGKARTAYEIMLEMTWMAELGGVKGSDLESWNKRMAVLETLAHLELMRVEGKVDRLEKDDVFFYRRVSGLSN